MKNPTTNDMVRHYFKSADWWRTVLEDVTSKGGAGSVRWHYDRLRAGHRAEILRWATEDADVKRIPAYRQIRLTLAVGKVCRYTTGLNSNDIAFFRRRLKKLVEESIREKKLQTAG